jgi:hypothetical protein
VKVRSVPTFTDCAAEIFSLRAAGDEESLTKAQREALLADVRGNPGSTAKIRIEAVTYLQADGAPNRNHVRFREGAMRAIAKSFRGAPFLRDHNQREMLARGGTVVDSQLVEREDGSKGFVQTIELTKPWAIEAALDGTLDRFSIGWRATGPVTCTICSAEFESGFFGLAPTCDHEPGQTYEVRGGAQRLCEAEFSAAEGVECSGVSVPAVADTGIESIRVALAAGDPELLRAFTSAIQEKESSMKAIATALGLAATVDESTILAEVEKRNALLDAERKARVEAEAHLAAAREAAAQARRTELAARAIREGKVIPGSPMAGTIERLALTSLECATDLVDQLPRLTPVGQGLLSAQPPAPVDSAAALSETDRKVCAQLKLTPAQFLATKNATNGGI